MNEGDSVDISKVRFAFGKNWARYLELLDDERIALAEQGLKEMLGVTSLVGKRFLDIGSGSGLFSLAARNLGATVYSFDYDPESVNCTKRLKDRYWAGDEDWRIEQGDVLNKVYLSHLGQFDVVYSWGVLHHTGKMWQALDNAATLVVQGGQLFIAIYNDQGRASKMWLKTKRAYNRLPEGLRWLVLIPALLLLWGPTTVRDILRFKPFFTWQNYERQSLKGMNAWRDVVDWVGGLPFEVAKPEQIFELFKSHRYILVHLRTCAGGHGCNEFVFKKE